MNSVMQCMQQHHSVRQFTDEAIDSELLSTLLRCGQSAASSSFIQAYSVVRVTGAEHREQIAQAAGGQTWVIKAPEFLVYCADLYRIEQCCIQQGLGELQGHTEHFIAATVDVALMAQNVLLAAESQGLGGVFIGGIRNNPQLLSELLDLPDQVYPVFGMCLGWPAQHNAVKPRMPVEMILHQGQYQTENVRASIQAYDQQMADYYQQRGSNQRLSDWSEQTANAVQKKKREHMQAFLQERGFLKA